MLEGIKYGITHGGCFHADDVCSSVFIKRMNKDIQILRVFEITEDMANNKENIIYDIGHGKFDHHQSDVEHNEKDIPYSAFGLLWREYGRDYLRSLGFKNIDYAFHLFKEMVVYKIDLGDNFGYKEVEHFAENDIIKSFYLKWYEQTDADAWYKQFEKAMKFVNLLWDNWIRNIYQKSEVKQLEIDMWNNASQNKEGNAIFLEKRIPWEFYLKQNPDDSIHYIIFKSERGGYVVRSTDQTKYPILPNSSLSFVHNSGFMGIADTYELAQKAVQELEMA